MRGKILEGAMAVLLLGSVVTAQADVVEFIDPCVKARREFSEQSTSAKHQFEIAARQESGPVTTETKTELWKEVDANMRKFFDEVVAPEFRKAQVQPTEENFASWKASQIQEAGGVAEVEQSMVEAYTKSVAEAIDRERGEMNTALAEQKKQLDGGCRMDAGNTALRVGVRAAMAPVALVGRTFERSKNEKTAFGKVFAVTTFGGSWDSIRKHGFLGGKNSELRKVVNVVQAPLREIGKGLRKLGIK
jgi:hypothetical protein